MLRYEIDWEKTLAVLVYLAARNLPEFDKYKACKLVFLSDKYHLVKYARPITGDVYFAVKHGPIPSNILNRIDGFEAGLDAEVEKYIELDKRFAYPRWKPKVGANYSALSQSDMMALDYVSNTYGPKTFGELRAITHAMPAYLKAWESKEEGSQRAEMSFEDFFEEDAEAVNGALEEAQEQQALREAFPHREF